MIWGAVLLREAETLLEQRNLVLASERFQSAERGGANVRYCLHGKWMTHMLSGNFEAAWKESDRARALGLDGSEALWRGEDITDKRVIARCLHGFGDVVQFLRYAPWLQRKAKGVIWEVPPALLEVAPCFDGLEEVVSWGKTPSTSWDVEVEIMQLPYLFRTQMKDLPGAERYLHLPYKRVRDISAAMGPSRVPRIGVVWSAGSWNASRSIPLELLTTLLSSDECDFWNLQGEPEHYRWSLLPDAIRKQSIAACRNGILNMASVLSQLDLVVTVDTLAAHLAGALGVPAWVMLQYAADWRWMVGRDDSPWYPSLRLFRQTSAGNWESVVNQMECAFAEWIRSPYQGLVA